MLAKSGVPANQERPRRDIREIPYLAVPLAAGRDRSKRLQIGVFVRLVEDQSDLLRAGVEEALDLIPALLGRAEDRHGVDQSRR